MIKQKRVSTIKQLVHTVHCTANGKLRSITRHGATESYPNGYVYTRLKGGKTLKAKTIETLYERLYEHYFGAKDITVEKIFELALEENSNVLIQNGIAVTDRAKLLGHSPEVNLRNYSYASRDYLENICNVLNCANKKELSIPLKFKKEKQWEAL